MGRDDDVWWNGAPGRGGVPGKIGEDLEPDSVGGLDDIVHYVVMSPGISALIEIQFTAV